MITSSSNAQVKRIRELNEKAKARREAGLFVAEGRKLFEECPGSLRESVYVSETFADENPSLLAGVDHEVVADHLFARITDTKTPQGVLTVARMTAVPLCESTVPLLLFLEDLQDPGNIGTILRTAEAAGAAGVILGPTCADVYSPKAVRATMGSIFRVPVCVAEDLSEEVGRYKKEGVRIAAALLDGDVDFGELTNEHGIAFLIGNEGKGLSEKLAAMADLRVHIPMAGRVESLNAAVAAALLMYQVRR